MKKSLFTAAIVLFLAVSLAACSVKVTNKDNGDPADSGGSFEYGDGTEYIANHLTGDYSITYKYSATGSNDSLEVTCARTSEDYYYAVSGSEMLFIKNGDKYDLYTGSTAEGFKKVELMEPYTREQVETQMILLSGFMSQYGVYATDMNRDGSETIAGRKL